MLTYADRATEDCSNDSGNRLFSGTLDIGENLISNALRGITPTMAFQYIASGLIGAAGVAFGFPLH
jgi:hypothetical protein